MPRLQVRLKMLLCLAAVLALLGQGAKFEIGRRTRARDALDVADVLQRASGTLGDLVRLSSDELAALERDPRLPALHRAAKSIEWLHQKKRVAEAGDWLARYQESGQTFDQYLSSNPNRPREHRTRFYLQPIGEFTVAQRAALEETADLLSRFYGLPVELLDPLSLDLVPAQARRTHPSWGDEQLLTTYVLDNVLKPRCPDDAVAVLALTTADLWPGQNNFVFGQASRTERVGVWSLYRFGDADDPQSNDQFRRRLFKVALHEMGHTLGMMHCVAYECCMNGSNSLEELDRNPMWLCPECVRKVWWACSADPAQCYQRLADFAGRKTYMVEEATFWSRSRDCLAE
ncbi:MAG TPA: archaemetzincin [Pirellulales bacterium]|nr:archaemetzincin [Pirellulales bacterium]